MTISFHSIRVLIYLSCLVLLVSCESLDGDFRSLDPDLPGMEPEIFAEGIISKEGSNEFSICFAPDLREILFSRREPGKSNQIMHMRITEDGWSDPVPFMYAQECFEFEPYISPDGKYLFYGSKRPVNEGDTLNWFPDIWMCEKSNSGWSGPIHYSTGMMYLSMTNTGRIYFTGFPATMDSQHVAYQDSLYAEFIKLSDSINYLPFAGHPLIGPDEEFLIYDSQTDTDNKDIYISFKDGSGNWTMGHKMQNEINTEMDECCSMLSPDNKFLFFAREGDIYWISAEIIKQHKPAYLK